MRHAAVLGTLRSHPEIKWQRDESDIARLCRCKRRFSAMSLSYLKVKRRSGLFHLHAEQTMKMMRVVEELLA